LLLLILFNISYDFEAVATPPDGDFSLVTYTPEGALWASSGKFFYLWSPDGALSLSVDAEFQIWTAIIFQETIILSGEYENGDLVTKYFSAQGHLLNSERKFYNWLSIFNGNLYGLSLVGNEYYLKPFHYLANEYNLQDHHLVPKDFRFFKVRRKQREFHYSFKDIWCVEKNNSKYIMNQLEPEVYIYNDKVLNLEGKASEGIPYQGPSMPLKLPGYVPAPDHWFNEEVIWREGEDPHPLFRWHNSWSRITYFNCLANGNFVVAYTLPGEPPYNISFAFLNPEFRVLGQVTREWSLVAGVKGNAVVLCEIGRDPATALAKPILTKVHLNSSSRSN